MCPAQLTTRKIYVFVTSIEKYIEDVKQDQKSVPDLLEWIKKPTDLVKEEFWRISLKMHESRDNIVNLQLWFQLFECLQKTGISAGASLQEQSRSSLTHFPPELCLPDLNRSKETMF